MNLWKQYQSKEIQIGGWKCPCCTPFGTDERKLAEGKRRLRRRTRRRIKIATKKMYTEGKE